MPYAQDRRDRARPADPLDSPAAPDILDAEILGEPAAPGCPPAAETTTVQQQTQLQLSELQTQLQRDQRRDRRRLLAQLQDTENRLLGHLFNLYSQTDRLERKLDRLLADRYAQRSQRSTLALLALLVLGVAYIAVIHPALRDRPALPPPPAPSQPAAPASPGARAAPPTFTLPPATLSAFFGSSALASAPNQQQRARGRHTSYRITDTYRVRPVHPSTGQRSRPECLGKSLETIDAQQISGCVAHRGVDVGTPVGTPLAAIAQPGSTAHIACVQQPPWGTYARLESPSLPGWTFIAHHLQSCRPGAYAAGETFGTTGTAGTGPHLHFGVKYEGRWLAPPLGFVEWLLAGEKPTSPPSEMLSRTPLVSVFALELSAIGLT